jgi:uncharacterized protein (DUF885 family)
MRGAATGEGNSGRPTSAFERFLDDDWHRWLGDYPEIATSVGWPGHDDRWTDDSPAGLAARGRHLEESETAFRGFERTSLAPSERVSYDLYRDLLATAREGMRFGFDPLPYRFGMPRHLGMPLNQMDGIHLTAPDILDAQPRATTADYERILLRLERLPTAVDQTIALLRAGLASGVSPARAALQGVPHQVESLLPADPTASALLAPFTKFPLRFTEAERRAWTQRAVEQYSSHVAPAFRRLHEYLVREYLPACRSTVGVDQLPNGKELYRYLVKWETTTELSPAEIHEKGMAEVRRIRAEMEEIRTATGFTGDFRAFAEFLRTDRRFYYSRAEDLVEGYRALAKRIDPELSRAFGRLPRLPYGVVAMPEFKAASSPSAYYLPGAPATGRAGYFHANTHQVDVRPKWEMEALTLHEAVPGHHLQIALAQELDGIPEFRRFSGYTAFVEGWGLYAESLGEELGCYRDPYSKFGQLTFDMWRSIRLVVDTGMHELGWSRDQAIRFFRENTGKSDLDIAVEVDRYIVWPGQALAYKIGQLKHRELRTYAERELGERFDVRRFHDVLLGEGSLPLDLLTARVHEWVAREKAAA